MLFRRRLLGPNIKGQNSDEIFREMEYIGMTKLQRVPEIVISKLYFNTPFEDYFDLHTSVDG